MRELSEQRLTGRLGFVQLGHEQAARHDSPVES
jgi:hypothetical protein